MAIPSDGESSPLIDVAMYGSATGEQIGARSTRVGAKCADGKMGCRRHLDVGARVAQGKKGVHVLHCGGCRETSLGETTGANAVLHRCCVHAQTPRPSGTGRSAQSLGAVMQRVTRRAERFRVGGAASGFVVEGPVAT